MDVPGRLCVVSPYLLVAQAVTAALKSVGTSADVWTWESLLDRAESMDGIQDHPLLVVAVTDGVDNRSLIGNVDHLLGFGGVRVVVITSADDAVNWGGLLQDDALDVLTVDTSVASLASVVDHVVTGGAVMDVERRQELREQWAQGKDERVVLQARLATLSPQQHRVLELLASGRRVTEVARELGVSSGTIRSHVKALRFKLGAATQLKAVAMYHQAHGRTAASGSSASSDCVIAVTRSPDHGESSAMSRWSTTTSTCSPASSRTVAMRSSSWPGRNRQSSDADARCGMTFIL
jgi:DNA-binding NarL/FixJ family response regulator